MPGEWGKLCPVSIRICNAVNELASRNNINARLTPVTNGTLENFRDLLRLGKPTIVHGYFTGMDTFYSPWHSMVLIIPLTIQQVVGMKDLRRVTVGVRVV